jgi:hypothetical protein
MGWDSTMGSLLKGCRGTKKKPEKNFKIYSVRKKFNRAITFMLLRITFGRFLQLSLKLQILALHILYMLAYTVRWFRAVAHIENVHLKFWPPLSADPDSDSDSDLSCCKHTRSREF